MNDWNNFIIADKGNLAMNSTKYRDSNCADCVHRPVCKLQDEYIEHVTNLRKYVDPKLDKFSIDITCNFFRKDPCIPRAPIV